MGEEGIFVAYGGSEEVEKPQVSIIEQIAREVPEEVRSERVRPGFGLQLVGVLDYGEGLRSNDRCQGSLGGISVRYGVKARENGEIQEDGYSE